MSSLPMENIMLVNKERIHSAWQKIKEHIRETPLEYSYPLSKLINANIYLKLETFQYSGSFKFRGVANKLLSLSNKQLDTGVVVASTGNHAAAFAEMISRLNKKGYIFLPENTQTTKVNYLKNFDVSLHFYGHDCLDTELYAQEFAKKNGMIYVSPYDDQEVIEGQGTIGLEIDHQMKNIDTVYVPVGGGGLISGISSYLSSPDSNIKIVGCQPINSPVMYESIKKGEIVDMPSSDTLSDATAGGIAPHSITFDICQSLVKDFVLVTENEIKEAIKMMIDHHQMIIEGGAALTLAALIKDKDICEKKNVVLVISGKKLNADKLRLILTT